jgi:site-specific DNA recombinase
MGAHPQSHPMTAARPAEPVPVAFLGRTSTLVLQDPAASLRRQHRSVRDKLPAGWHIAAYYWDVESGGMDLAERGHSTDHQAIDPGIPRDGGMADLLAEASAPAPRFAVVMCEDIERSARDTFSALKLERELTAQGVPLFGTDEPIDVTGMNSTTVLIRRVKQGVAEWFRLQLKEKTWKGLREHSLAGWNIGPAPYGYLAVRVPHPVAYKAAQGRTKTRLALDPERAPVVAQMFAWRTTGKLGVGTITKRLNADLAAYPPPTGAGWSVASVYSILSNPKYTGYMVFGRRNGERGQPRTTRPQQDWIWSPQPAHPAIITRALWQAAQDATAEHSTSRDRFGLSSHPRARAVYPLRSRIRCRICQRRMTGLTRYNPTRPGQSHVYYVCPHDPANPRHAATVPDHPKRIAVREDALQQVITEFFDTRVFGPDRAPMLAAQIPATAAAITTRNHQQTQTLSQRLRQIDAAENAHAREIEALAHLDPRDPAVTALRTRILARFTELEAERATITKQLSAISNDTAQVPDLTLLDALPELPGLLNDAPPRLQQQLYQAFDLQLLYSKEMNQVTMWATITAATPYTLAAITNDSETPPIQAVQYCYCPRWAVADPRGRGRLADLAARSCLRRRSSAPPGLPAPGRVCKPATGQCRYGASKRGGDERDLRPDR